MDYESSWHPRGAVASYWWSSHRTGPSTSDACSGLGPMLVRDLMLCSLLLCNCTTVYSVKLPHSASWQPPCMMQTISMLKQYTVIAQRCIVWSCLTVPHDSINVWCKRFPCWNSTQSLQYICNMKELHIWNCYMCKFMESWLTQAVFSFSFKSYLTWGSL